MNSNIPKYMVVRLHENDCEPNEVRKEPLPPISIQILDRHGAVCGRVGYIYPEDATLVIDGKQIPDAVIEVCKRLEVGEALYLDADARPVEPF